MNNCRRHWILRLAFLLTLMLGASSLAFAQDKPLGRITYRLAMTRPASHLFEVSMEVETENGFPADTLDFQMPRWSPGRYAVFDFAVNVQEFRASLACLQDVNCASVSPAIVRTDNQTWSVETRGAQSVTVSYKVFGDDLSGTFSQLDARHANYNGGSIFMYIVGHKPDPVSLEIEPPANWRIINGRMESADQRVWQFPNYDFLIDTPTEIAPDLTLDEFKVENKTYRVMIHSFGAEGGKRAALVRDIEKIVRTETAMWGAPDFDSYTFLIHFAPTDGSEDGMEHLTSTQIIVQGALANTDAYKDALETVAHEFFHVWNVKRLRPVELGPWDFTKPLSTRSMWIAEGITNYYGHMMLRRAELWSDEELYDMLARYIASVENAPGSRLMSAEDASLSASFLDGGVHAQKTNLSNTSVSYYNKGETLAIVLDLLLRGRTKGRASLDDVMRRMYDEFYVKSPPATYYLKGRGYTGADFERVTTEVAGKDMSDFFRRYVRGVEVPPYEEAFGYVGLKLVRDSTSVGASLDRSRYRIEERRDATPEMRALRAAWLKGI